MRPILARVGGKYILKEIIINRIPNHDIYIEPFLGSGAIFFNKEKARISILNDIDKLTYETFLYLKTVDPDEEFEPCNAVKEEMEYYANNKKLDSVINRLYRNLLIHQSTFCSRALGRKIDGKYLLYPSKGCPDLKIKTRLKKSQEKLKDTLILNEDYKYILKKFDGKNSFFYLDPPYENCKRLYENEKFNFEELRDVLKEVKGKFLLSINSSEYIKELFKEFFIEEIDAKSYGTYTIGKKDRKELLISNYEFM